MELSSICPVTLELERIPMQYEAPLYISEKEVREALYIVCYYFERKEGALASDAVESVLTVAYEFFRKGCHHPLVLANKTIRVLELERIGSKAA